jgi:hypothetical protein
MSDIGGLAGRLEMNVFPGREDAVGSLRIGLKCSIFHLSFVF